MVQLLVGGPGRNWLERIRGLMTKALGAYSLTILTRDALYAVRDPWGFRPLCVGRLNGGWVVASESCALQTIGGREIQEILPGEIVMMDKDGLHILEGAAPGKPSLCIFEYIYFARPDSIIDGQLIHEVRQELGRELAREHPVEADLVISVPDSATAAAIGYAQESGIPYGEGLIKNRYIGRTFIQPNDRLRKAGDRAQVQPLAPGARGQAHRGGGRFDRARQYHGAHRGTVAQGRRERGAPAHLLAAHPAPLLHGGGHGHLR